ncbi:MAG: glycosyltransferase family 39 protein [Proteobacteria bacterium]|nr:glycosyltransferase family 39 protein [Pseudomonadota bacterium]
MIGWRADAWVLSALSLGWLALLAFVGLSGEFPISDDWAYARATQTFLETGQIERAPWIKAPVVTNVAIGALFAGAFGFSFETLRIANAFLGWLGLVACYGLCRELGATRPASAIGTATLGLNPLYLLLSCSFMSDIAFVVFTTLALWCGARGLSDRVPRAGWWLAGGLGLGVVAILSRQVGLAIPLGLGAAWLVGRLRDPRSLAAVAVALGIGALWLWLAPSGAPGVLDLGTFLRRMVGGPDAFGFALRNAVIIPLYLGLFLVPVVCWAPSERLLAAVALAGGVVLVAALEGFGLRMPLAADSLNDFYLGRVSLDGSETLPRAPAALWWAASVVGFGLGALIAVRVVLELWQRRLQLAAARPRLALMGFTAVYLAVFLVKWPFFERYLLPVMPVLAALLLTPTGGATRRPGRWLALPLGCLLLWGGYSALGTRQHLELLRARSSLTDALLSQGVSPRCIDAGNEFGGWHNYHPDRVRFLERADRYWVVDDRYLVSLAPERPGYRAIDSREARRWLAAGRTRVTVFERDDGGAGADPCRSQR